MRYAIAVLLALVLAGTAFASHCPTLVKKIDEQLATHDIDSATRQQVMTLRDQGEALHKQGKHEESIKVLDEALEKLDAAIQ